MSDTKERILQAALTLFAQDGYRAVSVSAIAGKLGITKGALYKHYENKQAIFNSIVERMVQEDARQAQAYEMPEQLYEEAPAAYAKTTIEHIKAFTLAQFSYWTANPFASRFRKMLTLEQYRDPEMATLYQNCLTAGPVAYMEDIFRELMRCKVIYPGDPKALALAYFAPMALLIQMSDHAEDCSEFEPLLCRLIDQFMATVQVKEEVQ